MKDFCEKYLHMEIPMTNIWASTDEQVPYTTGMSFDTNDWREYKLFIVDEPLEVCGTVMGQGITFHSDFNCRVKHQGAKQSWDLQDDHIYLAQSKSRAY